jgi:hypothetical protein
MGGEGSGRLNKTETLIRNVMQQQSTTPMTIPIAANTKNDANQIIIPNVSPESLMTLIAHGATAGYARPATGHKYILWVGSVEPTNAVNGDVWLDTS